MNTSVVKSISHDEDEILNWILSLYNDGKPFDLDPSFSKGGFYRSGRVPLPILKSDILPQVDDVRQCDVRNLPLVCESISSVVFDPPFMFNPHGTALKHNRANSRYSMFKTWSELEQMYNDALAEFRRILKPNGLLAFKCQDYTDSKTTMTHCLVYQWALNHNFYAQDIFIRYRNHGPAYNIYLTQKHARKFHSYWFVFRRERKSQK